jgi:peptidoglycan/LPS O-acetylase OafA/YrhL
LHEFAVTRENPGRIASMSSLVKSPTMTSSPVPHDAAAAALRGDSDWRIELFRAIAASLVLTVHYLPFFTDQPSIANFFFTGVDLFFVLSGYVFAPYLVAQRPLRAGSFFTRRFFRIYPLYLLALAAYALLRWGDPALGAETLKHVFMLHTLENRQVAFYFNAAFWSLPPEIEFYLCLPIFAWLCRRRYGFAALLAGAVLLRLAINLQLPASPDAVTPAFILSFHLPALLVEFLFGSAAYVLVQKLGGSASRGAMRTLPWELGLLLAGLAALWLWGGYVAAQLATGGNVQLEGNPITRGNVGWFAAAAYAAMVAAAVSLLSRVAVQGRIARFALWAGGCSYGVYLFHTLAPAVFRRSPIGVSQPVVGLVCLALTVLVAALLHRHYEDPLRRRGRRLAKRRDLREQQQDADVSDVLNVPRV